MEKSVIFIMVVALTRVDAGCIDRNVKKNHEQGEELSNGIEDGSTLKSNAEPSESDESTKTVKETDDVTNEDGSSSDDQVPIKDDEKIATKMATATNIFSDIQIFLRWWNFNSIGYEEHVVVSRSLLSTTGTQTICADGSESMINGKCRDIVINDLEDVLSPSQSEITLLVTNANCAQQLFRDDRKAISMDSQKNVRVHCS